MSQSPLTARMARAEERLDHHRDRITDLHEQQIDHTEKTQDAMSTIRDDLHSINRNQERVLWVAIGAFGWYMLESVGLVELLKQLL